MKTLYVYVIMVVSGLCMVGCTKENALPETLSNRVDMATAIVKAKADFSNGPFGTVSGNAKIYKDSTGLIVGLENFMASAGPDLKVYLSLELDPVNFVNLGSLRSTSGSQTYLCPAGTDITKYKFVLIYCQQYKHLFGAASF
jgi:hypothetical protein